jgi:hypothetical protein
MEINKLNVNQITSVRSYLKLADHLYVYKKKRKFLFWTREEGFCNSWSAYALFPDMFYKEDIEKSGKRICVGDTVYFKPHVDIRMSDGCVVTKYFESEEKLTEFAKSDIMAIVNWVNV